MMYRVGGKKVRETIGTLAAITKVEDARAQARQSVEKAQAGINPVEERRASERAAALKEKTARWLPRGRRTLRRALCQKEHEGLDMEGG